MFIQCLCWADLDFPRALLGSSEAGDLLGRVSHCDTPSWFSIDKENKSMKNHGTEIATTHTNSGFS